MKKRSLLAVFVLSLITLGLYGFYWLYATRKEMMTKGESVPSFWLMFLPALMMAVLIMAAFTVWDTSAFNAIFIIGGLAGVVGTLILVIRFLLGYSRATEKVTGGEVSSSFCFWMAILFSIFGASFLWNMMIQYHFNRIAVASTSEGSSNGR